MHVTIRKATQEDFTAILGLVTELAVFQNSSHKVTNTVEQMVQEKNYFNAFIAQTADGEIVGVATYFFAYYTWVGKSLYLDDLYVKQNKRGLKIGSALLKQIFEVAKDAHCKRVRWQVSDWNKSAINFYEKCGAGFDDECVNCDFDENAIRTFDL